MGDFALTPIRNKMNIHHELIDEYTKDWKTNDTPWRLWDHRKIGSTEWFPHSDHPQWHEDYEYRRKPRTIRIGNYDVPEPLRVAPNVGTSFYFPAFGVNRHYNETSYDGCSYDKRILNSGMMHLTKEAAELHAKALISLTEQ